MPGAYAHITLAFESMNPDAFDDLEIYETLIGELLANVGYVELGAISPDMPYLVGTGRNASAIAWADRMHQGDVAARIGAGVEAVSQVPGEKKIKCLAWLLGFVEHIVFDVFLHPVVNLVAGGAYGPKTKEKHQECEKHQDVYIVNKKFKINDLSDAYVVRAVLQNIHGLGNNSAMDDDIKSVFDAMLRVGSPGLYAVNKPDIDRWYSNFVSKMKLQEGSDFLVSIGRHMDIGLVYPAFSAYDRQFVDSLPLPVGGQGHYYALFAEAKGLVLEHWKHVICCVCSGEKFDESLFDGWNLDIGTDGSGNLHFWS